MLLALILALGCGSRVDPPGTERTIDSAASEVDSAEMTTDGLTADVVTLNDVAGSEVSMDADIFTPVDVLAIGPGGTYAERCDKVAVSVCGHIQNCCMTAAPGCADQMRKTCMESKKLSGLSALAQEGKAVLDPGMAQNCDKALADLGSSCGTTAAARVLRTCMMAWMDPAKIGEPCTAHKVFCAGGQGECAGGSPNLCRAIVALGEPCSNGDPCPWDAFCHPYAPVNTCVPGGAVCGSFGPPGQEDVKIGCLVGQKCLWPIDSTCAPDDGVPAWQACTPSATCRVEHDCIDGVCVPQFCADFLPAKAPYCGDTKCLGDETIDNCLEDCWVPLVCGDGWCEPSGETVQNCPADCVTCQTAGCGEKSGQICCSVGGKWLCMNPADCQP